MNWKATMDHTYWRKQSRDEPVFPDILWSRPENTTAAGKLAVIGGHAHAFGAPGIAYGEALSSGVGVCNVLMPDSVKKTVKHVLPDADFGPSNRSGSFAKNALASLIDISNWADGVCLAGDLGRNSETAMLLESYVQAYSGLLTITQDAADYFQKTPKLVLERPDTLLVVSLAQLQKIFIYTPLITPITYGMTVHQLVEALHDITTKFEACIVVKHHDAVFVAKNGQIVSTEHTEQTWRIKTAGRASVFWLQNPSKQFEAVVSSLIS